MINKIYIIFPLVGILIGYFLLHPISMLIFKNELSLNIFLLSFSIVHIRMSLLFSLLGLIFGIIVALLQEKLINQKLLVDKQNILLINSNSEKETLLRILTHDLTNLVSSSENLLRLNIDNPGNFSESDDLNKTILHNLSEATALIQISKQLVGIESDKFQIKLTKHELITLIKETVNIFRLDFKNKNLKINYNLPDTDVYSEIEPTMFKHTIISNLIYNALKFSYPGETIGIKLDKKINNAQIEISNIGPRIPSEKLKNIFLVTSKTTTPGTSGEKGTGFGLPLVYKFIKKMNGHVSIESKAYSNNNSKYITKVIIVLPLIK